MKNKIVFLAIFLMLLLYFNNTGYALFVEDYNKDIKEGQTVYAGPRPIKDIPPEAKGPEYAPGEVIIKLKENKEPQILYSQGYNQRSAGQQDILSKIKTKYNLKDEKPVFEALHNQLKAKNLSLQQLNAQEEAKSPQQAAKRPQDIKQPDLLPIYLLKTDQDVLETCNKLKQDPDIEYAEPNYIMKVQMVPNDPYYSSSGSWGQPYDDLWGIKKIQCEQAWDISQGEGVVVAVIDTGVDYNHEDLAQNIWINPGEDINYNGIVDQSDFNGIDDDNNGYVDDIRGWDFANRDNNPMDGHGHGTHVSGTIAGIGNNSKGVIGVAPRAKIMAIKGLSDAGYGYISDLVNCVIYAADNGAQVLSNSWGGYGVSNILIEAFHYAHSKGCVAVAAAGNDNRDAAYFMPANIDTVIAVSATNKNDEKCDFSNWGVKIDVAAPGAEVLSLRANGTDMYGDGSHIVGIYYYRANGTSMACPHVAGVVALIENHKPGLSPDGVKNLIRIYAAPFASTPPTPIGSGITNAYRTLANIDKSAVLLVGWRTNTEHSYMTPGKETELSLRLLTVNIQTTFYGNLYTSQPDIEIIKDRAAFAFVPGAAGLATNDDDAFKIAYTGVEPFFIGDIDLSINLDKGLTEFPIKVHIDIPNIPGWPIEFPPLYEYPAMPIRSPAIADLDNDGTLEVVMSVEPAYEGIEAVVPGKMYVWHSDGNIMDGWPIVGPDAEEWFTAPVIADLDGDGSLDIIAGCQSRRNNQIYAWHSDGTLIPGWPREIGDVMWCSPSVADLDRDGKMEVIANTYAEYFNGVPPGKGKVHVFRNDGTYLAGWPKAVGDPGMEYQEEPKSEPVIADVDGDGFLEIIVLTRRWVQLYSKIYIWRYDGTPLEGWPVITQDMSADNWGYPPSVADLDGDGRLEIVASFCTDPELDSAGWLYVWHSDGTIVSGWPFESEYRMGQPAIADLDGDGKYEIFVRARNSTINKGRCYVFRGNGSIAAGWPKDIPEDFTDAPAIADLDGDGTLEVVAGKYVWRWDGSILTELPGGRNRTPAAIADLDGNGTLEVIASPDLNVNAWTLPYQSSEKRIPWPQFQHDAQHTGNYIITDYFVFDNLDSSNTFNGTWTHSTSVSGYYASDYQHAKGGTQTATWNFTVPEDGYYNLYTWYTASTNRASNAPFTINYEGGSKTVYINQRINGSQWIMLDNSRFFLKDKTYSVTLSTEVANGYVIFDALKVEIPSPPPPLEPKAITDNKDPYPYVTFTGTWTHSTSVSDYYASDYQHAKGGTQTATWNFKVPEDGGYDLYTWYTASINRASNAPFIIESEKGKNTVCINQRINGSKWVALAKGCYFLKGKTYSVTLSTQGADGYVIFDALKVEKFIPPPPLVPKEITDNKDPYPYTAFNGTWTHSTSVSGYYASDYKHAKGGVQTATWNFTVPEDGPYNLYTWYTASTNRASNAPFIIESEKGKITVFINQRINGSKWVALDKSCYFLKGKTYSVTLSTQGADNYVIFDALKVEPYALPTPLSVP